MASRLRKRCLPTLLLIFFVAISLHYFSPDAAAREKGIIIGLLPEINVFEQRQRFKPLAAYLSKRMGIPVELTIISRYGNIIERIKEEEIDGAFFGSFTGALAINQLGVVPLARPINMDGTSTYYGHIFVRRDSGIKTAADMKGKTLALVERATTAGYVFPLAWLKRNGVKDFVTHFSDHLFVGSHDAAINAVLNGKADVGAAKNTIYERLQSLYPWLDSKIVIIASSPRVPSTGLCVRETLPEKYTQQLKNLLLGLHESKEGSSILRKLWAQKFVDTDKKDYQPVLDLAAEAGIDLIKYVYYNK